MDFLGTSTPGDRVRPESWMQRICKLESITFLLAALPARKGDHAPIAGQKEFSRHSSAKISPDGAANPGA